jgi:gamma-glutamylcyclotransferase (GGCT)/AIG2-like uncharacterized protein YtfP
MGYVFEYGSLMKGMGQDSYLSTSDYLGKTRTKDKFVLVVESTIPYLSVRERAYAVSGELYQVSLETMLKLDKLHGDRHWYIRHKIKVRSPISGKLVGAWAYFNELGHGCLSPWGNFRKYMHELQASCKERHYDIRYSLLGESLRKKITKKKEKPRIMSISL